MTKFLTHCDANSGIFGPEQHLFVGKKIPLVGTEFPPVRPLICLKTPFVRILGFTLIELMVTLAVAAILVTVAVPSFRTLIQNSRITTQSNELLADLSYARSEAIRRAVNVGVCSADAAGTACIGTASGTDWVNGRLIFVDANNNLAFDGGEPVLRVRGAQAGGNTLVLKDATNPLVFGGRGMLAGGVLTNGTNPAFFLVCDDRGPSNGKRLSISLTGQPRSESTVLASCT